MRGTRVEALTDGVVAIAITIMVLELRVPAAPTLDALRAELPLFLAYVLSFVNVGIFWANHHHLFQATEHIDGRVLWPNLLLLFAISLVPFMIRWIGEAGITPWPTAAYGIVLALAAIGYTLTQREIIAVNGPESAVARAVGSDVKGRLSLLFYLAGIVAAFWLPLLAAAFYVIVAAMWLIPDRRIERRLVHPEN